MERVIAKIGSTSLGYEGHGILSAMLHVTYGGGSGQGVGGFCLDEPIRNFDGKFVCRQGTAYGMEWVARCLNACGVDSWEKLKGRTIMVLKEPGAGWGDNGVLGIGPLPTEPGKDFVFADLAVEMGIEAQRVNGLGDDPRPRQLELSPVVREGACPCGFANQGQVGPDGALLSAFSSVWHRVHKEAHLAAFPNLYEDDPGTILNLEEFIRIAEDREGAA